MNKEKCLNNIHEYIDHTWFKENNEYTFTKTRAGFISINRDYKKTLIKHKK